MGGWGGEKNCINCTEINNVAPNGKEGEKTIYIYRCEQVLFVYVSTVIPPCLTDQRNFITVLIVTREPEQTTFLF